MTTFAVRTESDTNLVLKSLVARAKRDRFTPGYKATDAEALGLLVAGYFQWDGVAILRTASRALEDANFHKESAVLDGLAAKYAPDPESYIDDDMRKALFAALKEASVGTDRATRLAFINKIVRRDGHDVDSLSRRAVYPLRYREFGQVMDVLNLLK